jgi:hypothetical protein
MTGRVLEIEEYFDDMDPAVQETNGSEASVEESFVDPSHVESGDVLRFGLDNDDLRRLGAYAAIERRKTWRDIEAEGSDDFEDALTRGEHSL